jgi:uncharacterized membrane protein YphA (DoxX/SURF4 family)
MQRTNKLLWVVQVLLALVFLFAGTMKFVIPAEEMAKQAPVSVPFIRFIGVCELLGAIGLVIPSALRILPGLTPIAAGGLVVIMIGATVLTAQMGSLGPAMVPLVVGLLAAFVAFGRVRLVQVQPRGSEKAQA